MFTAKDILIKPIDARSANMLCKRYHYSGKVVPNSQIHLGVFLGGKCEGIMQFGPSLCKKLTMLTVPGTGFNEFIELNRMAFGPRLPKNSESRALGYAHRLIAKNYPHIKWVISFADATQCGDGAIYRASGYVLTQIKKNQSMWQNIHTGEKMQDMQFYHKQIKRNADWVRIPGYMLRYIYFIDKSMAEKVKKIPFDQIPANVRMYKGLKRAELDSKAADHQSAEGGAEPTDALHLGIGDGN